MNTPMRKRTIFEPCDRHAEMYARETRARRAEVMVEGGWVGSGRCGCQMRPGSDFYTEAFVRAQPVYHVDSWRPLRRPSEVEALVVRERLRRRGQPTRSAWPPPMRTDRHPNPNRWYRGALIQPAGFNSAGIRWYAHVDGVGGLRADTLKGIKQLIRESLEV